jgi:hypothetical protein
MQAVYPAWKKAKRPLSQPALAKEVASGVKKQLKKPLKIRC